MSRQRIVPAPHWKVTPIARLLGPMQEFIHRSASSGLVLIAATVVALALANFGLAERYHTLLETYVGISIGPLVLKESILLFGHTSLSDPFRCVAAAGQGTARAEACGCATQGCPNI